MNPKNITHFHFILLWYYATIKQSKLFLSNQIAIDVLWTLYSWPSLGRYCPSGSWWNCYACSEDHPSDIFTILFPIFNSDVLGQTPSLEIMHSSENTWNWRKIELYIIPLPAYTLQSMGFLYCEQDQFSASLVPMMTDAFDKG